MKLHVAAVTWYTPEERLPADGQRILMYWEREDALRLGRYSDNMGFTERSGRHCVGKVGVTHWAIAPIPSKRTM